MEPKAAADKSEAGAETLALASGAAADEPFVAPPATKYKIEILPPEIKREVDTQLAAGNFKSWHALSKWLGRKGFSISPQALHRYGNKFERRLEAIRLASEQAHAVCAQFKDDDASMQEALMRLVQTQLFEVLVAVKNKEPTVRRRQGADGDAAAAGKRQSRSLSADEQDSTAPAEAVTTINLTALARSVAGLVRADAEHRKWSARARERVAAVEKKIEAAEKGGLSESLVREIRGALTGIDP